jgi:hypothetical protein
MVAETFFNLLDVGTSNARVLYNEQLRLQAEEQGIIYKALNIVDFKMQLVDDLVGTSLSDLFDRSRVSEVDEHKCVPIPGNVQARCAYCSLMSRGISRTRFQCEICGVPLCSMGSGKLRNDCFGDAHETEERRQMVLQKYLHMQTKNSKKK